MVITKKNKIKTIIRAVSLILLFLAFSCFVAAAVCHDCCGDGCHACRAVVLAKSNFGGIVFSLFAVCSLLFAILAGLSFCLPLFIDKHSQTPVSLCDILTF